MNTERVSDMTIDITEEEKTLLVMSLGMCLGILSQARKIDDKNIRTHIAIAKKLGVTLFDPPSKDT